MFEVKYLIDVTGKRTDVVLPYEEYNELLEEIEDLKAIAERKEDDLIEHSEVCRMVNSGE